MYCTMLRHSLPFITVVDKNSEEEKFKLPHLRYHIIFRIITVLPMIWFLAIGLPLPEWVDWIMLVWFLAGLLIIPLINAVARHYLRQPIMTGDDEAAKDRVRKAFDIDALLTFFYILFMSVSPIISMILAGIF